ncbi:MAG: glycosyltransferase, partial [Candidatus Acidiferrum sp.]
MNVSLIICTYNRCESLLKTLESVAASVLPPSIEWEVVVVDNNSQDQTSAAVEEFSDRHPGRFRYLFEPTQGLSNARNAGILAAQGEVIAFTDDDVIVHPSWLLNLTRPLLERSWAGAGGRVLPFQGVVLPPWLSLSPPYDLGGRVAALFDQGGEPKELNLPPYGANMAFRREMFQKYGHFRRDLGRRPDSLIGGEETEFGTRLIAARERLFYEPSAIVYHPVPEERLTKDYLLSWSFDFGRALILQKGKRSPVLGIPRHLVSLPNLILRLLPVKILHWLMAVNPQRRFFCKCRVWQTAGEIAEVWRQNRSGSLQSKGKNEVS